MVTISYDKLLLKTAFCCMASDGDIHEREIALIKSICKNSPLFTNFNVNEELNLLIKEINTNGKEFIQHYFNQLESNTLEEHEILTLIDFAVQTIKADDQVEYSEIKFFKNIRHRLQISDEVILSAFPNIEQFLEEDIVTDSFLDKITSLYSGIDELPKFDLINIESIKTDNEKDGE